MLDGGAQHEARIRKRLELDRSVALLEYGEFARRYAFRRGQCSFVRSDPGDVVALGRMESPALAGLQPHVEIGDAGWGSDDACHAVVLARDDAGGTGGA